MIRSTSFAAAVLLLLSTALTVLSSCENRQAREASRQKQPVLLDYGEWSEEGGSRLLVRVDSLERTGLLSPMQADFNRGIAYDMMKHNQVSEMYYHRAFEACDPETDGWDNYFTIGDRVSSMRMVLNDYEGALTVGSEMLDRAEKAGELTEERKLVTLWNVSKCELQMGMIRDWEEISDVIYNGLRENARVKGYRTTARLLVFTSSMASAYVRRGEMAKAAYWQARSEEELSVYDYAPDRHDLKEEYTWRVALGRVYIQRAEGREKEAEKHFRAVLPQMMESPEGMKEAAMYLMETGRFAEAADLYDKVGATLKEGGTAWTSLLTMQEDMIPRLRAYIEAGRTSKAMELASQLCASFDRALDWEKQDNATELAMIYATHLKDEQIAQQQTEMSRLRSWGVIGILLMVTLFFVIYDRGHRQHLKMLSAEHRKLEDAYSDLAQANLRAEESSRMKSHFIKQVSHEIRTPLNILSGFSQILTASGMELGPDERDEINRGILDNTSRITSLINKMLDLSGAVSDTGDVPDGFVTAGQIAAAAIRESGIDTADHLEFTLEEEPTVSEFGLKTNLAQAAHALAMLLDNAQKFTHPATNGARKATPLSGNGLERASLDVSLLEGRIAFVVEDSGIGVPPQEVEHIFEEFVQLDDYYMGTGIGLTVARALARRLGGDVVLDPSYTGGARFIMTLPIDH